MTSRKFWGPAVLLFGWAAALPLCRAGVIGYTDVAAFDTALSGGYAVNPITNFDSVASGLIIPSGAAVEGTTFVYSISGGFQMQVGSTFDTTSSPNYLGTTGDDSFLSGDQFTMSWSQPVWAVGLFVISGGNDLAGDYTLGNADGNVPSSGSTDSTWGTLGDGGNVYFVGLVDTSSFTSATFSSLSGLGIPFNIDDITTAAPGRVQSAPDEASTFGIALSAVAGLLAWRRRQI
jgi:MYXO-CTERM domain-containing protein